MALRVPVPPSRGSKPRKLDGSAVLWSAVVAGAVFLILEMLLVPLLSGGSPWGPPRMIAAIVLGPEVAQPPATFGLGMYLIALAVHFSLSMAFTAPLAYAIRNMSRPGGALFGVAYGVALYIVNFYLFTAIFPWFAAARSPVTLFVHIVFGALAALSYRALAHPPPSDVAMGARPRAPMV